MIRNTSIEGCTSDDGGGAIAFYYHGTVAQTRIEGCSFVGNGGESRSGGGLYVFGSDRGEGYEKFLVSDSELRENHAWSDGGGIFASGVDIRLERCSIVDNVVAPETPNPGTFSWTGGGGFSSYSGVFSLEDCEIVGNRVQLNTTGDGMARGGGVFYVEYTDLRAIKGPTIARITDCEITENEVAGPNADGGGVWLGSLLSPWGRASRLLDGSPFIPDMKEVGDRGSFVIENSRVERNLVVAESRGAARGGGICVRVDSSASGGVYVARTSVIGSEIASNLAFGDDSKGGGIWSNDFRENVEFEDLLVTNNLVEGSGGGISLEGNVSAVTEPMSFQGVECWGNAAEGNGGGLHLRMTARDSLAFDTDFLLNVDNLDSWQNQADNGAGMFVDFDMTDADNATFLDGAGVAVSGRLNSNVASGSGGGVFVKGSGPFRENLQFRSRATIDGNSASNSGGGIRAQSATVELDNASLSGNSATWGGGISIYNFGEPERESLFFESSIVNNTAGLEGGGACINSASVLMDACFIQGNGVGDGETYGDGGGLWSYGDGLEVRHSIIGGQHRLPRGRGLFHV